MKNIQKCFQWKNLYLLRDFCQGHPYSVSATRYIFLFSFTNEDSMGKIKYLAQGHMNIKANHLN